MAAKRPKLIRRACGAMEVHYRLLERDPGFRGRQAALEQQVARRRMMGFKLAELPIMRIPVVVHVVYNEDRDNISDAQIESQIKALNLDFRAENPDRRDAPEAWKGMVADPRVEFRLKKTTRTRTTRTAFGADDSVKSSSDGGVDAEDPAAFLNLWVCNLGDRLLGYAQFPGGPKDTDGVVITTAAFGTTGTARAPFNKGRTATHEIGHYLNLRHIWGDTEDCSGTDFVPDTPNAAGPNYGKPTFPSVTCNNGPNGDMFMNYMDYVDDVAMFMFTPQQVARMRTTLDGPRRSLWS
jgi:hypothetical protein